MTENEAKIFIQNAMEQSRNVLAELMLIMPKVFAAKRKSLGEYYSNLENCKKEIQSCEVAIKALEEIKQYRAIGTPEELQEMKKDFAEALSDWRQYRKVGTLEECQAAMEKQIPYKPSRKKLVWGIGKCKCGVEFLDRKTGFCGNCGQKLDWEDEE